MLKLRNVTVLENVLFYSLMPATRCFTSLLLHFSVASLLSVVCNILWVFGNWGDHRSIHLLSITANPRQGRVSLKCILADIWSPNKSPVHRKTDTHSYLRAILSHQFTYVTCLWIVRGRNPCRHGENMQTPHGRAPPRESNPGLSYCETTQFKTRKALGERRPPPSKEYFKRFLPPKSNHFILGVGVVMA